MTFAEQISIISFAVILVFCMAAYLRSHTKYKNLNFFISPSVDFKLYPGVIFFLLSGNGIECGLCHIHVSVSI